MRFMFSIFLMLSVNLSNAAIIISTPTDYGVFTISPQIDFGTVTPGSDLQPEITITNTGASPIQLGEIAIANPVAEPFRIFDPGCANSIIQPGKHCSVMVLFEPTIPGTYPDSFNIEVASEGVSHEVVLNGLGGVVGDEPDIQLTLTSIDFREVDVLLATDAPYLFPPAGSFISVIVIKNLGTLGLDIASVNVTGVDFSFQGDCVGVIDPGLWCGIVVEFKPLTSGDKNAVITIASNDPDEPVFDLLVKGSAVAEDDGVPAAIEDLGLNNGDGNNDDILDSRQSNVATLMDSYGNYVTHIVNSGYNFRNMTALLPTDVTQRPANLVVGSGIFDFTIEGVAPGGFVEVGIVMPVTVDPDAYYIYGATADNLVEHWYNFDYDGETGLALSGDAIFTTSADTYFTASVLKLIFKDGGRGDTDMTVNGVIAVTSAVSAKTSEGIGLISFLQILCSMLVLISARYFARVS